MKNKMKVLINLIIVALVAVVTFLVIKFVPTSVRNVTSVGEIQETTKVEEETLAMAPGALFDTTTVTKENWNGETFYRAHYNGEAVYCAMKGGTLSLSYKYSFEALLAEARGHIGEKANEKCIKPEMKRSRTYYELDSRRDANYEEAFILSYTNPTMTGYNDWSPLKQQAIWRTGSLSANKKNPPQTSNGDNADIINQYAVNYSDFMTKIKNNGNTMVKGDVTNKSKVKVTRTGKANEYIAGPFSINYISGNYGMYYGGITDMYLLDENSNRIEINSIIRNGTEYFTYVDGKHYGYFNPDEHQDNSYVSRNYLGQLYPTPGEEFYVKFTTTQQKIVKVHVDFKWMEAKSVITYYKPAYYQTVYRDNHTPYCPKNHPRKVDDYGNKPVYDSKGNVIGTEWGVVGSHTEYNGECGGCTFTCEIISGSVVRVDDTRAQKMLSANSTRWVNSASLEIDIPQKIEPTTPPNTPPEKNMQIVLAGNVWEDQDSAKQSLPNGVKDSNESWMKGIEVILHLSNGAELKRTVTDTNGHYEFTNLDAQQKYYIEFIYNGQLYQATQYNSSLTNEDRLAGKINNATEIASERNAFNDNFAQIGSAPGNYTVRKSLYYSAGSSNTAWIINKTSSETPYGIQEVYEYLIDQAVSTKNYSSAYENTLNHFGNNNTTKSKLQFIEDSRISSYTGLDTTRVVYPIYDKFTESTLSRTIAGVLYKALYPKHLNIDFGLNPREIFDLALRKDVATATIEINGKSQTYNYNKRELNDNTWDINVRLSDAYYNSEYSREIYPSDYIYKVDNAYGNNYADYGASENDELNVYVTYKLMVRNQSQSALGQVMEIVDYYDKDYTYVAERSYIKVGDSTLQVNAQDSSRYGEGNSSTIDGYNRLYVRGLENTKLTSGQTAYVYLTFKVNKDEDRNVLLDENNWKYNSTTGEIEATLNGVGKENIAEINGFRTYYRNGTYIPNVGSVSGYDKVAGLFDYDSVNGNLNPNDVPKDGTINNSNFEDDTDKAPNIRLLLYKNDENRVIEGTVWEEERNVINQEQVTAVGDGIYDSSKESAINGVTVQLVELRSNGTEYVWQTISSGQNHFNSADTYKPIINKEGADGKNLIPDVVDEAEGKYIFKSYPTGNFVVRFIYGDTVKTVLPNTSTAITNAQGVKGQNVKSYNGQDYKSTTYQTGITQNNSYVWRKDPTWVNGQKTLGEELTTVTTFKTNASNNETASPLVSEREQKGYLYDVTASDANANVSDAKDIESIRNKVIDYSDKSVMNYIAEVLASHEQMPLNEAELTNKLNELMAKIQMTAETGLINVEVEYDRNTSEGVDQESKNGAYKITNVNLGLEERPKAQLAINKEVTNVKLTLADGSTLFDASQKATNVLWRKHKPYKFKYKDNKLVSDPMAEIREKNSYDATFGLVQLSMDEELMHGATIKISYKVTVTNVGEVDYKDNSFYYTGVVSDMNNVVKTQANQVVDYIANNLQFYAEYNKAWKTITQEELLAGAVNTTLANETGKYNTIIVTSEKSNIANKALVPEKYNPNESSVSDDLVLTQLITSENETDDLTYRNIVEITTISNSVGRRMAYSVVGNQNPTKDAQEVDSNVSEVVKILPPFGTTAMPYVIGAVILLSSGILIAGIIFIKKKVLRK